MAAQQLLGDRLDDVAEGKGVPLLGHAGVEHDLEQQVAELVLEILEIAAIDGVRDLVGLLDGVGRDAGEVLLQVPRTAGAGGAQRGHDRDQVRDVARGGELGVRLVVLLFGQGQVHVSQGIAGLASISQKIASTATNAGHPQANQIR